MILKKNPVGSTSFIFDMISLILIILIHVFHFSSVNIDRVWLIGMAVPALSFQFMSLEFGKMETPLFKKRYMYFLDVFLYSLIFSSTYSIIFPGSNILLSFGFMAIVCVLIILYRDFFSKLQKASKK